MKIYYLKDTKHYKTPGKIIKAGTIVGMKNEAAKKLIKDGVAAEYLGGLETGKNVLTEKPEEKKTKKVNLPPKEKDKD